MVAKRLADRLHTIARRVRISAEYTFYQDYAWSRDRTAAAKELTDQRAKRDGLIFQGLPEWEYQKKLKAADAEIRKLEAALQKAEASSAVIAPEPAFKLLEANRTGTFPVPPQTGLEYQFCMREKVEGFVTGRVSEYYNRLYVQLRLYTRYSQSFSYEDTVIFSIEDTQRGVEELTNRVAAAVAGGPPASVLVHGSPEDGSILIDGSFAGHGTAGPLEHPPGTVEIESFAEGYYPMSVPLELRSGELAELYINLQPLSKDALTIDVPDETARVYQGALYLGETPWPAAAPVQGAVFFHVETPEGETGSAIVRPGTKSALFLQTDRPITAADGKVARARRNFYGSWARFWIALPSAFLLQGISDAQRRTYAADGNPELYQAAQTGYYISIGGWVIFGLTAAEVIYRTVMYMYTANKSPDPLVKEPK
jgi:hypothetical protein